MHVFCYLDRVIVIVWFALAAARLALNSASGRTMAWGGFASFRADKLIGAGGPPDSAGAGAGAGGGGGTGAFGAAETVPPAGVSKSCEMGVVIKETKYVVVAIVFLLKLLPPKFTIGVAAPWALDDIDSR